MKILIISGFLGAGKTTFIKELVKRTGKEIAILENEYGAAGIDGDALKSSTEVNIWELTEGCICCSVKGDFSASVLTIANTVSPDYLVIEPTGVAMLSNLIANLKQIEYEHIRMMAPIAIVDALSIDRYKSEFPDIFTNQIEFADTVILSKCEHLSSSEKRKIEADIRAINPSCRLSLEHYTGLPDARWEELMMRYLDGSLVVREVSESEHMPDTFSLTDISVNSIEVFINFLEGLIRGKYGNIIRAKGSFKIRKMNLLFDVADGRYSILLGVDEVSDQVVFIGDRIQKQRIREIFFANSQYIKIGLRAKRQ